MTQFPDSMEIDALEIHVVIVIINRNNTETLCFAVLESLNAWVGFTVVMEELHKEIRKGCFFFSMGFLSIP